MFSMLLSTNPACRQAESAGDAPTTNSAEPAAPPLSPDARHASDRADERSAMVATQIEARGVRDRGVLRAMRSVPRHRFVPADMQKHAYEDRPLPIGEGQTISQPYIVALMTELLDLKPGDKVLEIGTGSGYQAAILAELTDQVFTIEIVEPLGRRAESLLKELGYDQVHVHVKDGYKGWPEAAPFDAIIVTCAPESPPKPLVEQLAVGGRMCIPVGPQRWGQELIVLQKQPDGSLRQRSITPVRFVPMTGEAEKSDTKD